MTAPRRHRVDVVGVPAWLDPVRLLGPDFVWDAVRAVWSATRDAEHAADVQARLRGLGFDGRALDVVVTPALNRSAVRAARTIDARRRRDTTPGFARRGAQLDAEGRFSLTPEALALAWGHAAWVAGHRRVVDLGCGAGGNTIAFARAGLSVVAVERDATRLAMARDNARLYDVDARVEWRCADALETLAALDALDGDLVFVDPPWGEAWDRAQVDPSMLPLLGTALAARRGRALWAKLPPSTDTRGLGAAQVEAVFGHAAGDAQRVKCLLARWPGASR